MMRIARQLLASILHIAKSEQFCIQCMLNRLIEPTLRSALESQMQDYISIEQQAYAVGSAMGWDLPDSLSAKTVLKNFAMQIQLRCTSTDSKIAEHLILCNTKAIIKIMKYKNLYLQPHKQIDTLSQKLLDCETLSIRQLQSFL